MPRLSVIIFYIKTLCNLALALLSVYMIYNGIIIFINTSGFVQGSEFGMLITLVNQISLVMVWLALFAVHSLLASTLRDRQESKY